MKKTSIIALFLTLALLLCACSNNTENTAADKETESSTVSEQEDTAEDTVTEDSLSEPCLASENYTIDSDMLTYWYFTNIYYYNESYSAYLQYMAPSQQAPDFSEPLSAQYYDYGTDSGTVKTWHEYFLNDTLSNIKAYLCYAEEANDAGFEYADLEKDVTEYIDNMKAEAEAEDLSFDEYLAAYYGNNIDEADIRKVVEIQVFAYEFIMSIQTQTESEITDAEYEAYKGANAQETDDSPTKNVRHILITADTYGSNEAAKTKAYEILAEYQAGTQGADAFDDLASEYNEDGNSLYENVTEGTMVTEFNDWIFDEARVEGDTDVVETVYGYHIMYFEGDGLPAWKADAKDAIVNEKMEAYTEEFQTEHSDSIVTDEEKILNITDTLPEAAFTSTESDTTTEAEHDHNDDTTSDHTIAETETSSQ